MKITENMHEFAEACLDTAMGSVAVKARDRKAKHQFGRITNPPILTRELKSRDDLEQVLYDKHPTIIRVRGWGWDGETPFVWEGTYREFISTWECD